MNILNIAIEDAGGAGLAALRIHKSFNKKGFSSRLLVLKKNSDDLDVIQILKKKTSAKRNIFSIVLNKFLKILRIRKKEISDPKYCFNGYSRKSYVNELIQSITAKPDLIILYWITYYLTAEDIYKLYNKFKVPIYWYLMDMAPLTGGCHYAWDCKGYMFECGNCPAIFSTNHTDISYYNLKDKLEHIQKIDLSVICASEQLVTEVKRSSVFKNVFYKKILLGIDESTFHPCSREEVRLELKIPKDSKIVLFGADAIDNERKGIKYLLEALKILNKRNPELGDSIFLLIIGEILNDVLAELPYNYLILGRVKGDTLLNKIYNSSDVYVCPSVEDSGPMMINESIMCGTPVVSFNIGVAKDLVINGLTGFCVEKGNSAELSEGILNLMTMNETKALTMRNNCRALALELFSLEAQMSNMIDILKN